MGEAVRIEAPAELPVSLAEALAQCREDAQDEVDLVELYIAAATEMVEHRSGRAVCEQGWRVCFDAFPAGDIVLPFGPVTAVTISYLDADGASVEMSSEDFQADLHSVEARLRATDGWPSTDSVMNAVTVEWTAGDECPAALKKAILLLVAHWFDNRSAVVVGDVMAEIPLGVQALIATKKRFRGAAAG